MLLSNPNRDPLESLQFAPHFCLKYQGCFQVEKISYDITVAWGGHPVGGSFHVAAGAGAKDGNSSRPMAVLGSRTWAYCLSAQRPNHMSHHAPSLHIISFILNLSLESIVLRFLLPPSKWTKDILHFVWGIIFSFQGSHPDVWHWKLAAAAQFQCLEFV